MSKQFEVNIVKLEYPHNIRTRMGMYGCDGTNADILFREIVDNTVDLATKFKLSINVESWINQNDWNLVLDNGLGFPIYLDKDFPEEDRSIVRDMMQKVNVGSNFNQVQYSTGMNGTGSRLTQALSSDFILCSNASKKEKSTLPKFIQKGLDENRFIYVWHTKEGSPFNEQMMNPEEFTTYCKDLIGGGITKSLIEFFDNTNYSEFGTLVLFKPDSKLLDTTKVSYKGFPFALIKSLFQYDKDFKDIQLNFRLNGKEIQPYEFTKDFKEELIQDKILPFAVSIKTEDVLPLKFIVQVGWSKDKFNIESNGSVNLLETPAGKHLNIVQTAIGQAFVKYNSLLKYQDSRYGMRLFVLNMALKPLFNSQDKTKLSKWEDKGYDERATIQAISDAFYKVMKQNTEFFDLLCARILEYKRATEKLSNIELLKSKIVLGDEGDKRRIQSGEMSKVYECTSNDSSKRELYVVEGLSASSGLVINRDKRYQSILPLRGKLINTSGFDEERLVSNKEVTALINTIGCGIGGITDVSKARYGKIIISTDLDDDGCFTYNTNVSLKIGDIETFMKIGDIEKQWNMNKSFFDDVLIKSYNLERKEIEWKRLLGAKLTKYVSSDELLTYNYSNGSGTIHTHATKNHLFLTKSGNWTRLDELTEEVENDANDYGYFDLGTIEYQGKETENIPVYDIEVEDNHNFYANDLVVHNSHIANLVIGLFMQHCPDLVKAGMVYKLDAPFYRVTDRKGKVSYFYHDQKDQIDFENCKVDKLKGLGSYNDKETKEFLMTPETRRLIKIEYDENHQVEIDEAVTLLFSGAKRKQLMIDTGIFVEGQIK